jgi:response regulator RpfG family c-di-GMP phosphodiesterase
MNSLRQNKKTLLILLGAQLLCLAFGLWIQDRLLEAAARWNRETAAKRIAAATDGPGSVAAWNANDSWLENQLWARVFTWIWIGGLQAVAAHLVLTRMASDSSRDLQKSVAELVRRSRELVRTRNAIVFGLAKLADYRDNETGQHLERIALYATRLAAAARRHPRFRQQIDANFVRTIGISSALHDIGKVSIEDAILRKPAKLNSPERERMQDHTRIGAECIREIESRLGNGNFLKMSRQIAEFHHERWDGTGYASGLAGEAIPLAARIVAIADVYDALSVKRVYKEALPHEECVEMIGREAGAHFDPHLVEIFLAIKGEFQEIAERFGGQPANPAAQKRDAARHRPQLGADRKLLDSLIEAGTETCEIVAAVG